MHASGKKSTKVNISNKKDFKMFRKMILKMIICVIIYIIFYMLQNSNYIFSQDVIQKAKQVLSYDINIKNLYEQGMQYINSFTKNERCRG